MIALNQNDWFTTDQINGFAWRIKTTLFMRVTIFFTALIALCGCSFDQQIEYRIDPVLKPYVDGFFAEGERQGVNLTKENLVVFFGSGMSCAGLSKKYGGQRTVAIDPDAFDYWTKNADNPHDCIENLIFHELGHAVLYRGHNDPKHSIMQAGMSMRAYENNPIEREVLMKELFTNH